MVGKESLLYEKETFLNSTSPPSFSKLFSCLPSVILGLVFKTSYIRLPDTIVLGKMIKIIINIIKAITT